jgi:hypothetical protein
MLLVAVVHATPEEEQVLIKQAHTQLGVLQGFSASNEDRTAALWKLKAVRDKIKQLAAKDPKFTDRADNDQLVILHDGIDQFLDDESKKLGVDLNARPPRGGSTQVAGKTCEAIPLPDYSLDASRLKEAAHDVKNAYKELERILDEPEGETIQARAYQDGLRKRALEVLIEHQVRLAWEAAHESSAFRMNRIALLNAKTNFTEHLRKKRAADSAETEAMIALAEVHDEFNKSKHQIVEGKSPPNFLMLEARARQLIKIIMGSRESSNKAYFDYILAVEPMEKTARELFNKKMKAGIAQINFKLKQQGHKGPPFVLFRPKTPNDQRNLDRILGIWLIRETGIIGALENSGDWIDFDQFTDFDYDTRGRACSDDVPNTQTPLTEIGCADGSREGFLELEKASGIAACGGNWGGAIHGPSAVALCADGWSVCNPILNAYHAATLKNVSFPQATSFTGCYPYAAANDFGITSACTGQEHQDDMAATGNDCIHFPDGTSALKNGRVDSVCCSNFMAAFTCGQDPNNMLQRTVMALGFSEHGLTVPATLHPYDFRADQMKTLLHGLVLLLVLTNSVMTFACEKASAEAETVSVEVKCFNNLRDAIPEIALMLKNENWRDLAAYYDLTESHVERSVLLSGEFFIRKTPPKSAHPGGFWRYRHPFSPEFNFGWVERVEEPGSVVEVFVTIEIDQGGGVIQRGIDSFLMRKRECGYQILPGD